MKKFLKLGWIFALAMGLAIPACTVDGEEDDNGNHQSSKPSGDKPSGDNPSGDNPSGEDKPSGNTGTIETLIFEPVYFDSEESGMEFSELDEYYDLMLLAYNKKLDKEGNPSSFPLKELWLELYQEDAPLSGNIKLSNDANGQYYLTICTYQTADDDDPECLLSYGGSINLKAIEDGKFEADFKDVVVQDHKCKQDEDGYVTCEYIKDGKKAKVKDFSVSTKYFSLWDADDEDFDFDLDF